MSLDSELERLFSQREQQMGSAPPAGLHVSAFTWRQFLMTGGAFCPADRQLCRLKACRLGTRCADLAAEKGLAPNGDPLPRRDRPTCGAKTRAGGECQMRVEPGKRRCRLHGGLSTGPKTAEGRERIRAAQAKRWGGRSRKVFLGSQRAGETG